MTLSQKFWQISWSMLFLLALTAGVGVAMLYSASNGHWEPWASRQSIRFGVCVLLMIAIALIDVRYWYRYAYVIYFISLALLIGVEFMGSLGMGAQRWIELGVIRLQPSEIMKIALVLALARYFHSLTLEEVGSITNLIVPVTLIFVPAILVLRQPDLGTSLMLIMCGGAVFFIVGVRLWLFGAVLAFVLAILPVGWSFLRDYQKQRVFTFLDPERDPLGAGYHILQSKIALGSGGLSGKGFIQGTQSHLNFLPEKQTDFIFTMLAEEFGLLGGLVLLGLFLLLLIYGFAMSLRVRNQFGRVLGIGVTINFFLYLCINIAMVMGLIPVVGVPLPLISYGGTAMLTVTAGFGLLMSINIHRDLRIGRHGNVEDY